MNQSGADETTHGVSAREPGWVAPCRRGAHSPAHSICLSAETARLVSGYFAVRDLGEARVKGVDEPLRVYELEGMGDLHARFDVSRARGLTRFVGRDEDMRMLDQALKSARAGTGQVIGLVADAGTGKSRLCFEFACTTRPASRTGTSSN